MRYKWLYFIISAILLLPGIYSLLRWQFKPAIDFTGGILLELKFTGEKEPRTNQELEGVAKEKGIETSSIQKSGEKTYLLRTKPLEKGKIEELKKTLQEQYGQIEEIRFEIVGPTLGRELLIKTFVAAVLAVFAILSYIAFVFKNFKFGISAVIALLHDLLILSGIFSLLGQNLGVEADSLFVTAVLTTMSFSVHDTIVVFDRIREAHKKNPGADFEGLANKALNETMARSVNNSLTIIFMLLALLLMGGATIKWFVLALLVGIILGTYSSPFVATPVLVVLQKRTGLFRLKARR